MARSVPPVHGLPVLGVGVSLRAGHVDALLAARGPSGGSSVGDAGVDVVEVISENVLRRGVPARQALERVAAAGVPILLHGVSLSIAGAAPLDRRLLRELRALAREVNAVSVSDHLAWTGSGGRSLHDLLPVPRTEAAVRHVVRRVREAQELLERPLVLENPSAYVDFAGGTIPPGELLARVAEEADCGLLLDVNNVLVTVANLGGDPAAFVDALPASRIVQLHVAAPRELRTPRGTAQVDVHGGPPTAAVWALHRRVLARTGPRTTVLEWDEDTPAFGPLAAAVAPARTSLEALRAPA